RRRRARRPAGRLRRAGRGSGSSCSGRTSLPTLRSQAVVVPLTGANGGAAGHDRPMRARWNSSLIVDPQRSPLHGVLFAALAITVCTLVIYPIKAAAPVDSLGVVYILAVFV